MSGMGHLEPGLKNKKRREVDVFLFCFVCFRLENVVERVFALIPVSCSLLKLTESQNILQVRQGEGQTHFRFQSIIPPLEMQCV